MRPALIAILCPWVPPERSAVTQYVLQIAEGLAAHARIHVVWVGEGAADVPGAERTWVVPDRGPLTVRALLSTLHEVAPDRVVLEYSPYLWSQSGFDVTGSALTTVLAWRGQAPDVLFHELWIPVIPRPVALVRRLVQQALTRLIGRLARRAIVTSRERLDELAAPAGDRSRMALIPMCSLLPVVPLAPGEREALRRELGLASDELALVIFGFDHDSRPTGGLASVEEALAAAGIRSRLLVIGTATVPARDPRTAAWLLPLGFCPAERASRLFSSADVFLAPFVDGVSTRRTSVAAALAHRLPVVTTRGHHTDSDVFHPGVVELAEAGDDAAFAQRVRALAASPARRRELGEAGHALFARDLSPARHVERLWEVHAR